MTLSESLDKYFDNTVLVRELSSPSTDDISEPDQYRRVLLRNFSRIGDLCKENNDIITTYWKPLMETDRVLTAEEADALSSFSGKLLNAYKLDNIDLSMRYRQSVRLLQDADDKGDLKEILRMLDQHVEAASAIEHMTARLSIVEMMYTYYREEGIKSGERLLSYLEKDLFQTLPDDEAKAIVLTNARYMSSLFDRADALGDPEINTNDLAFMERALSLADDDFYLNHAPDYNWIYYRFRALQYIAQKNYSCNIRGFDHNQLCFILECAKEMAAFWEAHPAELKDASTRLYNDLHVSRSSYLAGEIDVDAYKKELLRLYSGFRKDDFSYYNSSILLLVPMEMFLLTRDIGLREEDEPHLADYYQQILRYFHRMPKKGSLSSLLTYAADVIEVFTEVRGGIDFETMCLRLMASLHPPTYVHTLSVTDFSVCLCRHLLKRSPELFVGVCGATSAEDVSAKAVKILDFTRHAALCHDIGKLYVIEVIMTYGRALFDEEFHMIKLHPLIGAYLLERHKETAPYANVARFHHLWYDGSAGYPTGEKAAGLPEKIIIDIVTCADCLDASTDDVGRSYKQGKTLDDYIREVHDGSGTRYAPFMAELLADPVVRTDVEEILSRGRDENYRKAYRILSAQNP